MCLIRNPTLHYNIHTILKYHKLLTTLMRSPLNTLGVEIFFFTILSFYMIQIKSYPTNFHSCNLLHIYIKFDASIETITTLMLCITYMALYTTNKQQKPHKGLLIRLTTRLGWLIGVCDNSAMLGLTPK